MARVRRKIATLLSANVAGYRGLVEAGGDDSGNVFEALETRRAILKRLVAEHGGREFGSVGDARMAEFPSALNGLRCAIAIQQAVSRENEQRPARERLSLRIGLNVGEVIEGADGSLTGEGVDVAASVRALAAPGGIAVSGAVHDHVKQHAQFEFMGDRKLDDVPGLTPIYQVLEAGVERAYLSLWTELKRRNVFRTAAAYAVIAWLLIQVADVVLPTFDTPPWVMRGMVTSVVVGFPIVLLLAWLYELTPLGLMRNDEALRQRGVRKLTGRTLDGIIIGLLAAAVVFLVIDNYVSLDGGGDTTSRESIAVLAFANLSPDPANEYFSDGVAEEILNVLARVSEFKVASRTSSFNFKGKGLDVGRIAAALGVDNVLEGSVRRDADQIRVTATLVRDGAVIWTETYDRSLQDVLEVQSEIAFSVASAIVPVLSPASERRIAIRPTESVEAYDFYLRGRDYLNQPAEQTSLESAIGLFSRAIELDPRFAAAWAARCEAYLGRYEFSARDREFFDRAQGDCRQAWTLDNGLWDVHVALGRLYRFSGLNDNAISELQSAITQQPNAVEAYLELGNTYASLDRLEQAEAMFRKAIDIDRGYWGVYRAYGNFLYDNERYREATEQYKLVIEFTPDSGIGYDNLANAYWAMGDFEHAGEAFESSLAIAPSRWAYSNLGSMQYYLGDFESAAENQRRAIELAPENHEAWGRLAEAYRFLPGQESNATSAYEKAIELVKSELLINPDDWLNVALLGQYYTFTGRRDEAFTQMQHALELVPREPTAHYFDALSKWHFGLKDAAYDALEQALELGFAPVFVRTDPDFAPLRGEPRFQALLAAYD